MTKTEYLKDPYYHNKKGEKWFFYLYLDFQPHVWPLPYYPSKRAITKRAKTIDRLQAINWHRKYITQKGYRLL